MSKVIRGIAAAVSLLAGSVGSASGADILYSQARDQTLSSSPTGWDYIKFQPDTPLLFMARLADGLTIFDVDTMQPITTVKNSVGANGPLLLPEYNRGYVAMDDGSLLNIKLDSLEVLDRQMLVEGRVINSGIFDPFTKHMHFITGIGENDSLWFTLDPASGKMLRTVRFPFRKMDDPATDGAGSLYAPALLDNIVLKLDSVTLKELDRWTIGCPVAKLRYDSKTQRLIGACRGDNPQLFLLNPANGEVTATAKIGSGVDGMAIDQHRSRIVTSDGEGGFLSVIERDGVDSLRLLGRVNTQDGARMMDIDQRTGNLYVVNADFTRVPDLKTGGMRKVYHPNSFNVREWTPLKDSAAF